MNQQLLAVIIALATVSLPGRAAEIELFRASQAGENAWVWDTAQAKPVNGKLLVRRHQATGDSGDAYVADRFP